MAHDPGIPTVPDCLVIHRAALLLSKSNEEWMNIEVLHKELISHGSLQGLSNAHLKRLIQDYPEIILKKREKNSVRVKIQPVGLQFLQGYFRLTEKVELLDKVGPPANADKTTQIYWKRNSLSICNLLTWSSSKDELVFNLGDAQLWAIKRKQTREQMKRDLEVDLRIFQHVTFLDLEVTAVRQISQEKKQIRSTIPTIKQNTTKEEDICLSPSTKNSGYHCSQMASDSEERSRQEKIPTLIAPEDVTEETTPATVVENILDDLLGVVIDLARNRKHQKHLMDSFGENVQESIRSSGIASKREKFLDLELLIQRISRSSTDKYVTHPQDKQEVQHPFFNFNAFYNFNCFDRYAARIFFRTYCYLKSSSRLHPIGLLHKKIRSTSLITSMSLSEYSELLQTQPLLFFIRGDGIVTALDSGLAVNEILKITSNIKIFPTENTSCANSLLSLFKVTAMKNSLFITNLRASFDDNGEAVNFQFGGENTYSLPVKVLEMNRPKNGDHVNVDLKIRLPAVLSNQRNIEATVLSVVHSSNRLFTNDGTKDLSYLKLMYSQEGRLDKCLELKQSQEKISILRSYRAVLNSEDCPTIESLVEELSYCMGNKSYSKYTELLQQQSFLFHFRDDNTVEALNSVYAAREILRLTDNVQISQTTDISNFYTLQSQCKVTATKKYLLISNLRANVSDEKVNFQFDGEESFSILDPKLKQIKPDLHTTIDIEIRFTTDISRLNIATATIRQPNLIKHQKKEHSTRVSELHVKDILSEILSAAFESASEFVKTENETVVESYDYNNQSYECITAEETRNNSANEENLNFTLEKELSVDSYVISQEEDFQNQYAVGTLQIRKFEAETIHIFRCFLFLAHQIKKISLEEICTSLDYEQEFVSALLTKSTVFQQIEMDTMRVGLHSNKLVHRAELLRFVANPIVSLMISRPNMDVQERSIDIQDGRVLLYSLKGILDIERSSIEFQVDGYENYAVFFEPGFSYLPIDREVLMNVTIEWKTKEQNHVQSKICLFQDLAKKREEGNKKTAFNIAAGGEEDSSRSLQGCNNKADRHELDDSGSGSSNHFESQNRFRDSSLRIVPSEHAILYHIGAYLLNNSDTADTLTNIVMFLSENTKELLHHEIERTLFDYPDIFEKDIIGLNITKFQLLPFPWVKTLFKMSALELDCPFISYASETTCSIEKAFTSGNNSIILLGVRSVLTEGHLEIRFTDFTARLELPTPTQFEESRTRGYMDSYENVVLSNIQANLTQNGVVLHVIKVLIERFVWNLGINIMTVRDHTN